MPLDLRSSHFSLPRRTRREVRGDDERIGAIAARIPHVLRISDREAILGEVRNFCSLARQDDITILVARFCNGRPAVAQCDPR